MEKTVNDFNEFMLGMTSRRVILLISLIFSIGLYRYIVNNLFSKDDDFINTIWSNLISEKETFSLFSGDASGGDYSLYYRLGKEISDAAKLQNFLLQLKGTNNSALSNAFGVMNNTNSFGIVQSDTYLQAEFLQDKTKIRTICSLYMERLHILVKYPKDSVGNEGANKILLGGDSTFNGNRLLEGALNSDHLITGGPTSSARNYLSLLLKESKISYEKGYSKIRYGSYGDIFEFIENKEPERNNVVIAIFTLGTHDKVGQLLENPQYKLMAIDPTLIHTINRKYNQKLETTYFDGIYNYDEGVPTIGAYALLVASSDLSNYEILKFLRAMMTITSNGKFHKIFENPPISLSEVASYYEYQYKKASTSVFSSFIIFLSSVIAATVIGTNLIMWFTSNYKKVKYYREFIKDYNNVIDTNNSYNQPEAKIENLTRGMRNIALIASKVRNDFETGGMTNSDHEYLIDNLNKINEFYKERLAQRMNDKVIGSLDELSTNSLNLIMTKLQKEISNYYSQDYLTRDSYFFLLGEIRGKLDKFSQKNDDGNGEPVRETDL